MLQSVSALNCYQPPLVELQIASLQFIQVQTFLGFYQAGCKENQFGCAKIVPKNVPIRIDNLKLRFNRQFDLLTCSNLNYLKF